MTQSAMSIRQETVNAEASGANLRVLHFVPRMPWPLNTGAKLRNYHLAREMAQRASITLLAFSENGETPDKGGESETRRQQAGGATVDESSAEPPLADPESFYERVILVGRDQSYTLAKIVRGAVGRTPLPVLNYTTPAMKEALARVLDEQDFDVVQIESIHLAEYLPIIRAARRRPLVICDWHNIESELMSRYSERQTNILRRIYTRRASRQMSRLERRAMREFDAHVVVSKRDGERLQELEPLARIFLIENGVDTSYYTDERIKRAHDLWLAKQNAAGASLDDGERRSPEKLRRIAFVGSMDYHANVDAAVSFAVEIWPRLREHEPRLIFTIVGRDPAPEVRELAEVSGIEVTGTVDDVRPYYYETLCAIIPLRVGGGSRLKILEAMAAGVPVVSTALGAEGLDVRDGENILMAETGEDFCEAITCLNEERRRTLIAGGRSLVFEQYDWSRLGALLFETYRNLLKKGEAASLNAL